MTNKRGDDDEGTPRDRRVRVRFEDEDGSATLVDATLGDVQAVSPLLADMLSLGDVESEQQQQQQVSVRTVAQNVAHMKALVVRWPKAKLREYAEMALALPEKGRLLELYRALDKYGFESAIEAVHDRLRDRLGSGRMSMTDIFRTFDCHPGVAMAVAGVGDRWQRDNLARAEAARVERLATDGPDDTELADMIGELEPGQCVFVVCDGDGDGDDDDDDRQDGTVDKFQSGALICRVPTSVRIRDHATIEVPEGDDDVKFAGFTKRAFAALSKDKRKAARAEYAARRRWSVAWRSAEMSPPIVPEGRAGTWLRYFCTHMAKMNPPVDTGVCVYPEGTPAELAEYIVMAFPSPCGPGESDMCMAVSNPDGWIGEEYSTTDGFDDAFDEESFHEEAWACPTLADALECADLGRVELVVKAVGRGLPAEVLHRTRRVDAAASTLLVG
jgi:hypothetical protein